MHFASAIAACLILAFSVGIARAEKRVALVIGNSAYKNAPALMNPKNDAQDIGKSLGDLGFFTIVATDLDRVATIPWKTIEQTVLQGQIGQSPLAHSRPIAEALLTFQ